MGGAEKGEINVS